MRDELPDDKSNLENLLRLGGWAAAAMSAVALALLAARTETGAQRIAALRGLEPASLATMRESDTEAETRRVSEALRQLTTDRDRLLARVTVLERNLDDVTGSVGKISDARSARESTLPAGPSVIASITAPATIDGLSPLQHPAAIAVTASAPAADEAALQEGAVSVTAAGSTEFAVDIGGGANVDVLRQLWSTAKNRHGALLEGLRPLIVIRESAKAGGVSLRLVAGPLANAQDAARICATFSAGGWQCQPAVFDGQRLALR